MRWTKGGKIAGTLICAVLAVALFRCCVATSYLIPSAGMENSLQCGERILVNKWSYGWRLPFMKWIGYHRLLTQPVGHEDILVFNNPANLKEPVIDQREVFINRCIGRPGDTLLVDSLFHVISSKQQAPDQKFLYSYPTTQENVLDSVLKTLSISSEKLLKQDSLHDIRSFSRYEYYLITQALNNSQWLKPLNSNDSSQWLKPLIIPGKNISVPVNRWNQTLLRNTLVLHEKRTAEIKNDTLFVEGQPVTRCHFSQDYYWVVSNNPINLSDSRLFGLVPHSHIIGKASWIWLSKNKERIGTTIK